MTDNSGQGLSESEVLARRNRGQGNNVKMAASRSYADILWQNIFTFINIVLFVIGAILLSLGRVSDAVTSVGLIFFNIIIGIYQELRAKRQLDQIALLTRPRAAVIRDGQEKVIDPSEIVLGDLLVVRAGDQIVVDGVVVGTGKIDADESLLTGESDLIPKKAGDEVMSGSFCVTGTATYEATRVGAESFANKLTTSARAFRMVKTPLQRDIDFVIRLLMGIAIFLGFLLLISVILFAFPITRSVQMAAVVAGLVPNGLFFMVIVAYAMGALRIANRGALIQQTNSVESLSNVNVLCMDKTGTLTANRIEFNSIYPIETDNQTVTKLLGDYATSVNAGNRTSDALKTALGGQVRKIIDEVPFSSAWKWSALTFDDGDLHGVYVLGALEMLEPYIKPGYDLQTQSKAWSDEGLRVVLFAYHPEAATLHDSQGLPRLPNDLIPLGIVSFSDVLRDEARETLSSFARAGIQLKVISGDNPHTVAALAKQAGLPGDLKVLSGTEIDQLSDGELATLATESTIFGRITPQQKERLVDALKGQGNYVAMIGDGVNDVLSLKKANLGIAMQSGSAATRSVADMVLLNDSFAALPPAFLEGQRIVSGMQDILRLFLTRALYVTLLILSTAVVGVGFPYVPLHISLLTFLTVGIPTLALAAWARPEQPKEGLLRSVIHFVGPATITIFVFGLLVYLMFFLNSVMDIVNLNVTPAQIANFETYPGLDFEPGNPDAFALEVGGVVARTALTVFSTLTGLLLIIFVEPPIAFFGGGDALSPDKRPTLLTIALLVVFIIIMAVEPLRSFFELIALQPRDYVLITAMVVVWAFVLRLVWRYNFFERFFGLEVAS
ncbi:MAG: HAD-IC family P-type ATPase [Pseudomonadales bacterium]|nr:HAD-IC family P-type ATPase [Pseudomonadales bacterium]